MDNPQAPHPDPGHKPSFWSTMPGILSGLAALLTAVAGLLVAANGVGLLAPATPLPVTSALAGGEVTPSTSSSTIITPSSLEAQPVVESAASPTPLGSEGAPAATPTTPEPTATLAPSTTILAPSTAVESLELELVTGDLAEAGTADEVTLALGRRNWKLSEVSTLPQEPSSPRRYSLEVGRALLVGDLEGIKVCKEKGKKDPWYLAQVRLHVNGQPFGTWEVNQWLDNASDLCWQE